MENGILIRKTAKNKQIVLPENYHQIVFSGLHETLGHLGSEKDSDLAKQRFYFFYWPYMTKDIIFYVTGKMRIYYFKKVKLHEIAPLAPIETRYPFEMVSLSLLHLDRCTWF